MTTHPSHVIRCSDSSLYDFKCQRCGTDDRDDSLAKQCRATFGKLRLVALVGRAGSGKDTAASMMPAVRVAFADPLKEACALIFGWDRELLWGPSHLRNTADPRFTRPDGQPLTVRHALQTLGTEWGRAHCDPDLWVKLGIIRAQQQIEAHGRAVITDCRFDNEARAVRAAGGEVWKVTRPEVGELPGGASAHASEAGVSDDLVDAYLFNGGTLDDLLDEVRRTCAARGFR